MANNRGVRWFCLWWAFSVCVLCSSVAEAAKRVTPQMNTGSQSTGGAVSRNSGSLVTTNGLRHGQYIKFEPGGRKMHIPVTQGTFFSINGITINAQNMFRRNLPAIVMGGAIAGIGYGLDWIFDDGEWQVERRTAIEPDPNGIHFRYGPIGTPVFSTPFDACDALMEISDPFGGFQFTGETFLRNYDASKSSHTCIAKRRSLSNGSISDLQLGPIYREGSLCPEGSTFDPDVGGCVEKKLTPITEADIAQIAPEINGADPAFIQGILRDACNGSNAPDSCFDSLIEKTELSGPTSVTTPSSTSTTTTTGPDGVAGTTTTTTNTTFNITYGPNHYTYNTTKNTTTTKPDGTTDTTTETDAPAFGEEPPEPEEVELDVAQPCAGDNCAGPAYVDLYTPSEVTKESVLDEYITRATQIPLFQAVTGFFDVSVSASCPVWSAEIDFSVMGIGFDHSLLFDYHCQPWFTDYRPYAMAVFLVVGAFLAFRIAVL